MCNVGFILDNIIDAVEPDGQDSGSLKFEEKIIKIVLSQEKTDSGLGN